MSLSTLEIFDRIYAGFIGKAIGVRLGAPVEPTIWSYERIRDTYGEVTQYLRDFKNFAADDDTNGPVYFIRALRDYRLKATAADIGRTWLNYAAEEHGMYWWGGFGNSTEHTAYKNLKSGMEAPKFSPSQIASAFSARRRFSRMAIYSISGVSTPRRAYSSCVTDLPSLARSTFGRFGNCGASAPAETLPLSSGLTSRASIYSTSPRAVIQLSRRRGSPFSMSGVNPASV